MPPLFERVAGHILRGDYVVDIGPGIRPQPFYKAKTHLCIEPHYEYVMWLHEHGYPVLQGRALERLQEIEPADCIFMLDVIEHMDKKEGFDTLALARKKARQVVVFTPLGFHEQSYNDGDLDAWGMKGTYWQTHRSGWLPEEFTDARIFSDPSFHGSYGAFFALFDA